jgi:hypothetical protein
VSNQVGIIYSSGRNSKETGEIFRISLTKSARGIRALLVASREQIRPVENVILVIVILLPVKYLLKLSGPVIFTDYV